MSTAKIETTIQADGELHLTQLPFRKGERVEAIVQALADGANATDEEMHKDEARQRFLNLARASMFRSLGPHPSRDELHERH